MTGDRNFADPAAAGLLVALVLLACANARAFDGPPTPAAPQNYHKPSRVGRRRRDIRPPRAC